MFNGLQTKTSYRLILDIILRLINRHVHEQIHSMHDINFLRNT